MRGEGGGGGEGWEEDWEREEEEEGRRREKVVALAMEGRREVTQKFATDLRGDEGWVGDSKQAEMAAETRR